MNKIVFGIMIMLLTSCSPNKEQMLSIEQLELLEQTEAVENAGLCDETGCLALDPTHYWWGSYCHDTPEVTVRLLFNHSSTGNVGHTSGAGSVSFQH